MLQEAQRGSTARIEFNEGGTLEIQEIAELGIAGNFITFKFTDGTVVLEREDRYRRIELRPVEEQVQESGAEGEDNTNHQ